MSETIKEFFDKDVWANDQTFHTVNTFKMIYDEEQKTFFLGFGEWTDRVDSVGNPLTGVLVKTQLRLPREVAPNLVAAILQALNEEKKKSEEGSS